MRLLFAFARQWPTQTAVMLIALFVASIFEGVSLSALLPLLNLLTGAGGGTLPTAPSEASTTAERFVLETLAFLGIPPTLGWLLALIVAGITLKALFVLAAKTRIGYIVARVTTNLRLELLHATLGMRFSHFLHQPAGMLANALATETLRVSQAFGSGTQLLGFLIQTAIYIAIALLVSWRATLASVGAGLTVLALSWFLVRAARKAGKRQTTLMKRLLSRFADILRSVKPLKAMGREHLIDGVLAAETKRLDKSMRREVLATGAMNALHEPLFAIVIAGGMFVALNVYGMPFTEVMMLVVLLGRVLDFLGRSQKQLQKMATGESAYWSLRHTIDEAHAARETTGGRAAPPLTDSIRFTDLHFAYDGREVLQGVTLDIPAGRLTTLIGASGSGKTTLVDLVCGLTRPASGEVWIDGMALGEIDLKSWRRQIGYVPQENVLLHDTVRANITLNDPVLDDAATWHALDEAGAGDFVRALTQGLDTTVGEGGMKLSGGQRQRLMIARALVHRPRLLILDEATTALDPATEASILDTLAKLRGELTLLAISHQPAITRIADRVWRIEGGKAISG